MPSIFKVNNGRGSQFTISFLATVLTLICLIVVAPAYAYHFPWDQGHDTTSPNKPNDPGPCEKPNCDPCSGTGSPVYAQTGHFIWTEEDIDIPGRPGLTLVRTYNSHDPRDGVFGRGWSTNCDVTFLPVTEHGFDSSASPLSQDQFVLRTANGKRYTYNVSASGDINSPAKRHDTAVRNADGSVSLVRRGGGSRTFSSTGRLILESSPSNQVLSYEYDAADRLTRMSDNAGRFIAYDYNSQGRVANITDNGGRVWQYGYDADGNLTTVTNPNGGITQYAYQEYRPSGDGHTYFQMVRITDPGGIVLSNITYSGDRVSSYSVGANQFQYTYDSSQRRVDKIDSLGSRWVYTYNEEGEIVSRTDPAGGVQILTYDAAGNLVQLVDERNENWLFTFDGESRQTSATNPAGETISWEYSGDGPQPTRAVSPSGRVSSAEYDTNGNIVRLVGTDNSVTAFSWDGEGNLGQVTNAANQVNTISTNTAGLPLVVTNPAGQITRFTYDAVGNITSIENNGADSLQINYDGLGRPVRVVDPTGLETIYSRDAAGRLLTVTDTANRVTSYAYDSFGRVISRTTPEGRQTSYSYYDDNLISQVVYDDGAAITYTYDAAKRLTQVTTPTDTIIYAYDARHQLTTAQNSAGSVIATYDDVGRLSSETVNGQTISYGYNAEGERVSVNALGESWSYIPLQNGRTGTLQAPEGDFTFSYDALSRRTGLSFPNGQNTTYTYNNIDQLMQISFTGHFTEDFNYSYDAKGLINQWTMPSSTWNYSYDQDGQLISADNGAQSYTYTYDESGNRTGNGESYDQDGRLLADDTYNYVYDARGNLTQKTRQDNGARIVYRWNELNQLVGVDRFTDGTATMPFSSADYLYGPLGRRWSRTVDSTEERYIYDGYDRIAVLDGNGAIISQTTHGPRIDEPLSLRQGSTTRYLHADHIGSIAAVTSSTGIDARLDYSPFGQSLATSPSFELPFRFVGREYEADDLYYMRARYYDTTSGRFLSQDPVGFAGGDLNLYRYAGNNPVHFSDPTGEAVWFAIPIIWGAIEIGLSVYDAYDTANTIADPCKEAWEKWLAGGLFVAGALLPGGGYSAADDIITSKPVKEGIYEFVDTSGKRYVGQSNDIPRRLQEHINSGKLDAGSRVDVRSMPGSNRVNREMAEHNRIQEITGGQRAKDSDLVSNQRDPIGPNRRERLRNQGYNISEPQ